MFAGRESAHCRRVRSRPGTVESSPRLRFGGSVMRQLLLLVLILVAAWPAPGLGQDKKPAVEPTAAKVAYGEHERQVLDFWQAKSDTPTPLVLYIHGGGWQNGDKSSV